MKLSHKKFSKQVSVFLFLYSFVGISFAQMWEYTVEKGDTLWGIANDHFIDVLKYEELRTLNKVENPYLLQPGRQILAPYAWLTNLTGQAKLIAKTGRVVIKKGERSDIPDESTDTLYPDDSLITDSDGSATIEFSDKSRLNIYADTEVKFKIISQSQDGKVLKARIAVEKGRIDVKANPDKKQGRRLEIETPSAVTAVRGTSFRIGQGESGNDSVAEILTGKVNFNSDGRQTSLNKGLGIKAFVDTPPIDPVKLLPAANILASETHDFKLGSLQWEAIEKAKMYRVRVSSDNEFSQVIYDKVVSINQVSDIYFHHNGPHFASVRGIDSYGIEGFDGVKDLAVKIYPLAPLPIRPENLSEIDSNRPKLSWNALSGSMKQVQLQLAQDYRFEDLLIDQIVDSAQAYKVTDALDQGTYYWRLAGIDQSGRGSYSAVSRFTVN